MKVIEIRCDGCDVIGDDGPTAHAVRRRLALLGWGFLGRRDWCPSCASERRGNALAVQTYRQ